MKDRSEIIRGFLATSKQWKESFESEQVLSQNGKMRIEIIDQAIRCAISDFTFRTTKKKPDSNFKGGVDGLFAVLCSEERPYLNEQFIDYFSSDEKDEMKFDEWHHEVCRGVLEKLKRIYIDIHYGKAQKIVNMTFKYLYCIESIDEKYFIHCHIPLDSIILHWIWSERETLQKKYDFASLKKDYERIKSDDQRKAQNIDRIKQSLFKEWSNLDYEDTLVVNNEKDNKVSYTYMFYQKLLRDYCKGYPSLSYTPLQLEFFVWAQFKWENAAAELYKQSFWLLNKKTYKDNKVKAKEMKEAIIEILNKDIMLMDWTSLDEY